MAPNGFWDIEGEPYTTAPGSNFRWFRSRIEGGRTNHWGRIALRFGPTDFKVAPPMAWATIGRLRTKSSRLTTTKSRHLSEYSARKKISRMLQMESSSHPKASVYRDDRQKSLRRLNITCIPSRLAILTKPLNGRDACHYCAQCGRGCITASNFSSSQVMIPVAKQRVASR